MDSDTHAGCDPPQLLFLKVDPSLVCSLTTLKKLLAAETLKLKGKDHSVIEVKVQKPEETKCILYSKKSALNLCGVVKHVWSTVKDKDETLSELVKDDRIHSTEDESALLTRSVCPIILAEGKNSNVSLYLHLLTFVQSIVDRAMRDYREQLIKADVMETARNYQVHEAMTLRAKSQHLERVIVKGIHEKTDIKEQFEKGLKEISALRTELEELKNKNSEYVSDYVDQATSKMQSNQDVQVLEPDKIGKRDIDFFLNIVTVLQNLLTEGEASYSQTKQNIQHCQGDEMTVHKWHGINKHKQCRLDDSEKKSMVTVKIENVQTVTLMHEDYEGNCSSMMKKKKKMCAAKCECGITTKYVNLHDTVLMVVMGWSLPLSTQSSVSYINRQLAIWISMEKAAKVYCVVATKPTQDELDDARKYGVELLQPKDSPDSKNDLNSKLLSHLHYFPQLNDLHVSLLVCHSSYKEATADTAIMIRNVVFQKAKLVTVIHGIPEDNKKLSSGEVKCEEEKLSKYGRKSSLVLAVGTKVMEHLRMKFRCLHEADNPKLITYFPAPTEDMMKDAGYFRGGGTNKPTTIRALTIANNENCGTRHRKSICYGLKKMCEDLSGRIRRAEMTMKWEIVRSADVQCGKMKEDISTSDLQVIYWDKEVVNVSEKLHQSTMMLPHIEPGDEFNIPVLIALAIGVPTLIPNNSHEATYLLDVCEEYNVDAFPVISLAIGDAEENLIESGESLKENITTIITENNVACKRAQELRKCIKHSCRDGLIASSKVEIVQSFSDLLHQVAEERFKATAQKRKLARSMSVQ